MNKLFQLLLLLSISSLSTSCQNDKKELANSQTSSTEAVLQHNVYFYLNDSISQTDIKEFEKGLHKLLSIEVIFKSEVGKTGATKSREVTDHEFDYSIFTWFKSMDDYEIYAEHPNHLKFIENYKHLWSDVKVYDSEISTISDE